MDIGLGAMDNRVLLEGKIEGTKRRGRQKNTLGRDIFEWTNKSYEECTTGGRYRFEWRVVVADLLREMTQP